MGWSVGTGLFFIAPDSVVESLSGAQRIKKWIAVRLGRMDLGWSVGTGLFFIAPDSVAMSTFEVQRVEDGLVTDAAICSLKIQKIDFLI